MKHQTTSVLVPGADTAVLFIHGIVGSPAHFRQVIDLESRVPSHWSFVNLCLPGHGGSVTDFGRSRMKQWKAHVWNSFQMLAERHRQVLIVGHSMGTLFAIELAAAFPDKVGGIFLLQSPMYVGLRWFGIKNLLRLPFGRLRPENEFGCAMLTACGVETSKNIFLYASWIPRLLELFREMEKTRKLLPRITVPAWAFQSRMDELVSNRSAKLLQSSGRVAVTELDGSTHFFYAPEDRETVVKKFDELMKDPSLI